MLLHKRICNGNGRKGKGEGTSKYFTSDTTNVKNLVFETNHCNFHLSHDNSHLGLASVIRFNVT